MQAKRDFRQNKHKKMDVNQEFEQLSGEQKAQFESLKKQTRRYQGKSQSELMQELTARVTQGKREGTLNNEMMEQFARQVGPMLNGEQKQKMDSIIRMLKGK